MNYAHGSQFVAFCCGYGMGRLHRYPNQGYFTGAGPVPMTMEQLWLIRAAAVNDFTDSCWLNQHKTKPMKIVCLSYQIIGVPDKEFKSFPTNQCVWFWSRLQQTCFATDTIYILYAYQLSRFLNIWFIICLINKFPLSWIWTWSISSSSLLKYFVVAETGSKQQCNRLPKYIVSHDKNTWFNIFKCPYVLKLSLSWIALIVTKSLSSALFTQTLRAYTRLLSELFSF